MVSVVALLSRLLHTSSAALVFAYAAAPWIYASPPVFLFRFLIPSLSGVLLLSGLYNAGLARPGTWASRSLTNNYRLFVYVKVPLLLVFTPTAEKWLGDRAQLARAAVAAFLFLFGALARFTRDAAAVVAAGKKS